MDTSLYDRRASLMMIYQGYQLYKHTIIVPSLISESHELCHKNIRSNRTKRDVTRREVALTYWNWRRNNLIPRKRHVNGMRRGRGVFIRPGNRPCNWNYCDCNLRYACHLRCLVVTPVLSCISLLLGARPPAAFGLRWPALRALNS
jgi:hypothetical protein